MIKQCALPYPVLLAATWLLLFLATPTLGGDDDITDLDENGCRKLSPLPAAGEHPRVFFTRNEYPEMRARLMRAPFAEPFGKIRASVIRNVQNRWSDFGKLDLSAPTDAQLIEYFRSDEGRNIHWGMAALTSVLDEDVELRQMMIAIASNYARIVLAAKQRAETYDFANDPNPDLGAALKVWTHDRYDAGISWTFGASGYAVTYDVLHEFMKPAERTVIRNAIATATRGRRSYGNGMPRGFAASNHYGYHGDLAVLLAAIEHEEGFDQEAWDGIRQVLTDYWEIGFTEQGACHEDGYGPDLGLRAGGRGYLVLARRGFNIFETAKFRKFTRWMAGEYDPFPLGQFNGGASGGPYKELYPTSTILTRYMYPQCPVANFNYRQMVGENYERRLRWQGWLDFFVYGSAWQGAERRDEMLRQAGLSLVNFFPVRGKWIARSNWDDDAMYVSFDARADAHLIGHDKVDRGNFSMSALGRVWCSSGSFHQWKESRQNSLVHVDGIAQAWKAPSVRFTHHQNNGRIVGAAANLKYAYDWQWSPPWPRWGQKLAPPWEPETHSPIDLGWPEQHRVSDLCPDSIHGSDTGYAGRNNLHRRPFNSVRSAMRSVHVVRSNSSDLVDVNLDDRSKPDWALDLMLVCDDIQKDDQAHDYEWVMQIPLDLVVIDSKENEIVLGEEEGQRKLLVRFLQNTTCDIELERYVVHEDKRRGVTTHGQRLVATTTCVAPRFKVLLVPLPKDDSLPTTQWSTDRSHLTVTDRSKAIELQFHSTSDSGTIVSLAP